MNAWGYSVSQMQHANDVLFASVLRGKYTFSELESAIGYVAPIAAEAGVSLEEISAALASATRRGMHLDSVTRGLALIIQNVIDPTKEASDVAAQYGISLGIASLEAYGLYGFLEMVNKRLGSNEEALAKIFGNMRALRVVVGLTGEGMDEFAVDLDFMAQSSGKMTDALEKMQNTAKMAADVLDQSIANIQRRFGESMNDFEMFLKEMDKLKKQMYASPAEKTMQKGGIIGTYAGITGGYDLGDIESWVDLFIKPLSKSQKLFNSYIDEYKTMVKESLADIYEIPEMDVKPEKTLFNKLLSGETTDISVSANKAHEYEQELGTLVSLSEEYYSLQGKQMMGTITDEELNRMNELNIQIMLQEHAVSKLAPAWNEYDAAIDDASDAVKHHYNTILDMNSQMSSLKKEIGELGNEYDGTLGIQLKMAEATESLRLAQKKYNDEIEKNSLQIMRLQYLGMLRRRGNTRAEERMIKRLQMANLKARIDEQTDTEELVDAREEVIDEANQAELESLRDMIAGKEQAYHDMSIEIQKEYDDMNEAMAVHLGLVSTYFGAESKEIKALELDYFNLAEQIKETLSLTGVTVPKTTITPSETETHETTTDILKDSYTSEGITAKIKKVVSHTKGGVRNGVPTFGTVTSSSGSSKSWDSAINKNLELRNLKVGDVLSWKRGTYDVPYTGLHMLHEGETVLPKGKKQKNELLVSDVINIICDRVNMRIPDFDAQKPKFKISDTGISEPKFDILKYIPNLKFDIQQHKIDTDTRRKEKEQQTKNNITINVPVTITGSSDIDVKRLASMIASLTSKQLEMKLR